MMTTNITTLTTHPTTTPMTVEEEFSLLDCMPPDGITIAVIIEPVVDKVIEVVVTAGAVVAVMVTPIVEGTVVETMVDISSVCVLMDCITVDIVVDASTTSVIQNCETELNFTILQLAKERCNIIKTEM